MYVIYQNPVKMKKLKQKWRKFRLARARKYIQKLCPQDLEQKLSYYEYEVKKLTSNSQLHRPLNFNSLPESEREYIMDREIERCVMQFAKGLLEHELVSVYVRGYDGNPNNIAVYSELMCLVPRNTNDSMRQTLARTLPIGGHPFRIFPKH